MGESHGRIRLSALEKERPSAEVSVVAKQFGCVCWSSLSTLSNVSLVERLSKERLRDVTARALKMVACTVLRRDSLAVFPRALIRVLRRTNSPSSLLVANDDPLIDNSADGFIFLAPSDLLMSLR